MKKLNYVITLLLCLVIVFASANFSQFYGHLLASKNYRFLASKGNKAKFIDGYRDAVQIRMDHVKTETQEINAMHFIVREDPVGLAYLGELREAARRGVKVRVIFDHFGSTGSSSSKKLTAAMVKHLMDSGVEVKIFNVYPKNTINRLNAPKVWLKRMHEKILLFRGHQAFLMGDRDLSGRYFGFAKEGEKFLSRDLYVVGPEIDAVQKHFDDTFYSDKFCQTYPFEKLDDVPTAEEVAKAAKKLDAALPSSSSAKLFAQKIPVERWKDMTKPVKELRFIGDSYNEFDHRAYSQLLDIISTAKEKVVIQTPYLILNKKNHNAIKSGRANGASFEHITNNADLTDEVWVPPAADEDIRKLAAEGDSVYENVEGRIFHAKSYVVDNYKILYGSTNYDNRSMNWDRESAVYVEDEELAKELTNLIERDKKLTRKVDINNTPSFRSRSCKNMMLWFLSSVIARPIL